MGAKNSTLTDKIAVGTAELSTYLTKLFRTILLRVFPKGTKFPVDSFITPPSSVPTFSSYFGALTMLWMPRKSLLILKSIYFTDNEIRIKHSRADLGNLPFCWTYLAISLAIPIINGVHEHFNCFVIVTIHLQSSQHMHYQILMQDNGEEMAAQTRSHHISGHAARRGILSVHHCCSYLRSYLNRSYLNIQKQCQQ